ncbi:hypothetical protein ACJW31_11G175600 [Castanea mollissima]
MYPLCHFITTHHPLTHIFSVEFGQQVICIIDCISELLNPVLDSMALVLLLLRIQKYSVNSRNSILQFFKLIFDTPHGSNLFKSQRAQIFNDRLRNAKRDCNFFGHFFLVSERKH